MTPAQQVAWDAMRSAYDEATVKAMLAGPELLKALCAMVLEFGRDADIDEPAVFRLCESALKAAHGRGVWDSQRLSPFWTATGTGVCHCGDSMTSHVGMSHNHAPVEMMEPF